MGAKYDVQKVDQMLQDLVQISSKRSSIKDRYLLNSIERTIQGQKKIEKHLQDYLYTYRFCKMENDELQRIVKEAVMANQHSI
jgi:hypothetical protein